MQNAHGIPVHTLAQAGVRAQNIAPLQDLQRGSGLGPSLPNSIWFVKVFSAAGANLSAQRASENFQPIDGLRVEDAQIAGADRA